MENLGIKGTLYDVLGYLVPGIVVSILGYSIIKCHSIDFDFIFNLVNDVNYSIYWIIAFGILSYIIGQLVSHISSIIFESQIFKNKRSSNWKIKHLESLNKLSAILNIPVDKLTERILVSYCQQKFPSVYDTAFVFLSIYGFSRNLSFITFCIFISQLFLSQINLITLIIVISSIIFYIGYRRFKKYFLLSIISCASIS